MALTKLEWFPAGGGASIVWTTGNDAAYRLVSADGLGPVGIDPQLIRSPGQYGQTAVDIILPPRVLTIQSIIQAATPDLLWDRRAALSRAAVEQPTRLGGTYTLGQLRLTLPGRTPLMLEAMIRSTSLPRPAGAHGLATSDVEFLAPYPYWRELSDTLLYFSTTGGGFEFGLEYPLEILSNNVEQDVNNLGDVDSPPLFRIYGEATGVRMINVTADETIEFSTALTADQYLEIQTAFGAKAVDKVTISTGARVSAIADLNLALADFWTLRPGLNVVRFAADVNVSGHAEMLWRQRFSGV